MAALERRRLTFHDEPEGALHDAHWLAVGRVKDDVYALVGVDWLDLELVVAPVADSAPLLEDSPSVDVEEVGASVPWPVSTHKAPPHVFKLYHNTHPHD